ncbi:conserved domain protein [uncultured Mediterranean phage uvMED]|nr:conserved domain protein [uncultured Mediterranean phage uvMED]
MARETHKSRLLAYLYQYKSITSLEAIRDLGNTRLSATIFTLRDEGYNIESDTVTVHTRWGTTTKVSKYSLKSVED